MSFDRIAQLFPWATASKREKKNKRKAFLRYIAPAPARTTYTIQHPADWMRWIKLLFPDAKGSPGTSRLASSINEA